MEAANEAGRRAVNALLDRVGSTAPRAAIWPLVEPAIFNRLKKWDRLVFEQGRAHSIARAVWTAFRQGLSFRAARRAPAASPTLDIDS